MLTVNKIKSKNVKEFICGAKIEKKILTKQVKVAPPEPIKQEKDRKSTRLNSSHLVISYAVFCLKKKKKLDRVGGARCLGRLAVLSLSDFSEWRYSASQLRRSSRFSADCGVTLYGFVMYVGSARY